MRGKLLENTYSFQHFILFRSYKTHKIKEISTGIFFQVKLIYETKSCCSQCPVEYLIHKNMSCTEKI